MKSLDGKFQQVIQSCLWEKRKEEKEKMWVQNRKKNLEVENLEKFPLISFVHLLERDGEKSV